MSVIRENIPNNPNNLSMESTNSLSSLNNPNNPNNSINSHDQQQSGSDPTNPTSPTNPSSLRSSIIPAAVKGTGDGDGEKKALNAPGHADEKHNPERERENGGIGEKNNIGGIGKTTRHMRQNSRYGIYEI